MEKTNTTPNQQEIINLVKDFYSKYNTTPSMRALINCMKESYGTENANSIYLYTLFPKGISEIVEMAGLPKSARCI